MQHRSRSEVTFGRRTTKIDHGSTEPGRRPRPNPPSFDAAVQAAPAENAARRALRTRYPDIIGDIPKPPTTPLFVRLPTDAAKRLDRAAFERQTSKRELVTDAVVRLLDDKITVGRAEVSAAPDPEVLTVEQAAELLQVDADTIRALARDGELPGRKVGREWRFSRAAVLAWLAGDARS